MKTEQSAEVIETRHPDRKKGVKLDKAIYNSTVKFILQQMETQDEVTLASLLENAEKDLKECPQANWLVYYVKLDLEVRGFITLVRSDIYPGTRRLRLTSKALRDQRSLYQ